MSKATPDVHHKSMLNSIDLEGRKHDISKQQSLSFFSSDQLDTNVLASRISAKDIIEKILDPENAKFNQFLARSYPYTMQ